MADIASVPESYVLTHTDYMSLTKVMRRLESSRAPSLKSRDVPNMPIDVPREYSLAVHGLLLLATPSAFLSTEPVSRRYYFGWDPYIFKRIVQDDGPMLIPDRELVSEMSVEALWAGFSCLNVAYVSNQRSVNLLARLRDYDVPIAHSPKSESESLEKLLQTTKSVALVGLTASGTAVAGALAKGEYITALICAGTGSVVTLVFITTIAAGAILSSKAAQYIRFTKRRRLSQGSEAIAKAGEPDSKKEEGDIKGEA